jgi:diguanylate cyclase (GGDEF)-like protein
MAEEQRLQGKQKNDWLGNTTMVVFLLVILGALIYGVTVFHNGYIRDIQRGENGQAAIQKLDDMKRSLLTLKQEEFQLLQSTDKARAVSGIENSINKERQVLSKYLQLANYNEELRKIAPKLMVSFEAWASLELDVVKKKAALLADSGNRAENGEQEVLAQRSFSAFLNVMDVLGDGENLIQDDIEVGAAAVRGLLVSTLVFIAYLICLAFWWMWSTAKRERRHYKNVRQLYHLSHTDGLTGLTNRVIFEDRFSAAIAGARRYGCSAGVLYLDIDELKEVNDKIGRQAGDSVLREVALRLQKYTRQMDTVARVGEDEFAVLITDLKQKADAQVVADKLETALSEPFELDDKQYSPRVSIGVAVFPYDGEQPEQLVNHANTAMYEAKRLTKLSITSS